MKREKVIYADNAATTKLNSKAYEAMKTYLIEEYGNPSQPYSFARTSKLALKQAREIIAQCINAEPNEIYFTSGGTESDNWAIKGSAFAFSEKKTIITSAIEHHAILRSCEFVERLGYPVVYVPVNEVGEVSPESLDKIATNSTGLVSVMLANNEIGTIQNINTLADNAHAYGAIFHTDAVQAVGHIPVDVKALGVDLLSASAHKFGGPKGVGFLYIKDGTNLDSYLNGGSQESFKRAGTENVASILGMAMALKDSVDNLPCLQSLYAEEEYFISRLKQAGLIEYEDYIWNGNHEKGNHLPGLISISLKNKDGEALMHRLDLKGIIISTGAACDSINTQVSHVIKAIGAPEDFAIGTIRISLGMDICRSEVGVIADALIEALRK